MNNQQRHARSGDGCAEKLIDQSPGGRPKRRIALYSHDTMGIGHMRRNLLIAQTLAHAPVPAAILLIAGAHEVNAFGVPPGVDCLTLPSLRKEGNGHYQARRLDLSLHELIALRSRTIAAALEAFQPDVFIVDKVPRGAVGELDASLSYLRSDGLTRCVLGLRDVLDDPDTIRREWREAANEDAIESYYDAVWIYGDPAVYDPVRAYQWQAELAAKVRYTGYLDQRLRTHFAEIDGAELLPPLVGSRDRLVLCLLGGGQDGVALAETFAQADFPRGTTGVIVTGPFMPEDVQLRLRRRAGQQPQLRVLRFVTDSDLLLDRADCVVAMGGYNTVCDVLSFEKPALIVPRVKPRQEQLIRAERLRDLGLLEMLHPDDLTSRALTDWIRREGRARPPVRERIHLDGQTNLPRLLGEVLAVPPRHAPHPAPVRRKNYVVH
jgi:predicted glycosyltransferase